MKVLTLQALDVATDYEAVVKVKNSYGWSSDSDHFRFATRKGKGLGKGLSV